MSTAIINPDQTSTSTSTSTSSSSSSSGRAGESLSNNGNNSNSNASEIKIEEDSLPSDDERFLIELEFVQNLSNPKYLSYLAQNKYLQDPSFMEFLTYLRYFKQPEYLRHLIFPVCIPFLDALIDNARFRQDLLSPVFIEHIHAQQGESYFTSHHSNSSI